MTETSSKNRIPSAKVIFSTAATVAATAMAIRTYADALIPGELRLFFSTKFRGFLAAFSNEITLIINEFDGLNKNQLFDAAELYAASISIPSRRTFRVSLPLKEKKIRVSTGDTEEIADEFCKIQLRWRFVAKESQSPRWRDPYADDYIYGPNSSSSSSSSAASEFRCLTLTFHKKHINKVIDEYLPYVLQKSESLKEGRKTLKLHTLRGDMIHRTWGNPWQSVNLDHPAIFETLAMDEDEKKKIVDDLERFLKRKEMYRKVGKAWKRGYLLFGPPGTGKSSLIAAMANYLNFDVYDLELSEIGSNSDLRRLLIATENRSILVVEDIDLSERQSITRDPLPLMYDSREQQGSKITLSGLLNFIDGLWSSIGDERIIILTTNHKEKLDPTLLRPGRMDLHVHMSYCTPCGFRLLAHNYLGDGVREHGLMLEAEELIGSSKVTPAEVAEQLLKSEDPEDALDGLISFLRAKKEASTSTSISTGPGEEDLNGDSDSV